MIMRRLANAVMIPGSVGAAIVVWCEPGKDYVPPPHWSPSPLGRLVFDILRWITFVVVLLPIIGGIQRRRRTELAMGEWLWFGYVSILLAFFAATLMLHEPLPLFLAFLSVQPVLLLAMCIAIAVIVFGSHPLREILSNNGYCTAATTLFISLLLMSLWVYPIWI